jgi:hypothetical protein
MLKKLENQIQSRMLEKRELLTLHNVLTREQLPRKEANMRPGGETKHIYRLLKGRDVRESFLIGSCIQEVG